MEIPEELRLFQEATVQEAVQSVHWAYREGAVNGQGDVDIVIPDSTPFLIDLGRSRLKLELQVTRSNDTPIYGQDKVAPVNFILHSAFKQVDVIINNLNTTLRTSVNYPYKAIVDALLRCDSEEQRGRLQAAGFAKDTAGSLDQTNPFAIKKSDPKRKRRDATKDAAPDGSSPSVSQDDTVGLGTTTTSVLQNQGLFDRQQFVDDGAMLEVEGPLMVDVAQQKRALLSGVSVRIKMWSASDSFRLTCPLREGTGDPTHYFKLKIVSARMNVCYIEPKANLVASIEKQLAETPALYPMSVSDVRFHTIPGGEFGANLDLFHTVAPYRVIVGFLDSDRVAGQYSKNPFNFGVHDVSSLQLKVGGRSVPMEPLELNFDEKNLSYTTPLLNLIGASKNKQLQRQEFDGGYALYAFDLSPFPSQYRSQPHIGNTTLHVTFRSAVERSISVLVYASFFKTMQISSSRLVSIPEDISGYFQ